jgi:hypothetical protein
MKMFTFIVLAVMLVASTALAAEVPTSRGDKAMVFMFDGLCFLSAEEYAEYGVGMRYYIADGTAIRVGVQFGRSSWLDESDVSGVADSENNYSLYGLNAVYERHMGPACSSVSPYWGIGAGFAIHSDEYIVPAGVANEIQTTTYKGTDYEVFGVMGFEWGFTDCLTLGGDYKLGFTGGSTEREVDDDPVDNKYSDTLIGFGTASVYLSVYF